MRRVKRKIVVYLLLVIFCSNFILINIQESERIDPYFTLVFKTNGGVVRPDLKLTPVEEEEKRR
ncbi:MAG: hypothetical protein GPJ52_15310 [Candidatus Heimdallarchaeota archaeon]|nr:hypothetical protein [Candidatus Heimdallarchaeota archaeon]MCG3253734.1 hypothetical protein [Candidatus Heimdallarchaeota archaeon]MCK4290869.1 hypothetical protein [Candidatus Heimdallarchaeota archaeon]